MVNIPMEQILLFYWRLDKAFLKFLARFATYILLCNKKRNWAIVKR